MINLRFGGVSALHPKAEYVIVLGPSGIGKTHRAVGLEVEGRLPPPVTLAGPRAIGATGPPQSRARSRWGTATRSARTRVTRSARCWRPSQATRRVYRHLAETLVASWLGALLHGAPTPVDATITLTVDGQPHTLTVDTRTTVLDALREHLDVTSPKKGCDHGQCGACTVLVDDRRILSCLSLAVAHDGEEFTTADGLAPSGELHPMQEAFLANDAYQCGYCTPGQVCSAVGVLAEADAGHPSAVSADLTAVPTLDRGEIAERMSGNLCRCGAYGNIVTAVEEVAAR